MTNVGSWFVDVVPSFRGVAAKMQAETVPIATEAGSKAGKGFSDAFAESTKAGAANSAAAMEASAKRIEAAVSAASQRILVARTREEEAARKVELAEKNLAVAREKYAADSSQVAAAEERLATAQGRVTTAAGASQVAQSKLNAVKADATALSTRTVDNAAKEAVALEKMNAVKAEATALSTKTVTNAGNEATALEKTKTIMGQTSPVIGGLISQYGKLGAAVGVAVVLGIGIHGVKAAADFQSSQERLVTTAGELQSNLKSVGDGVLAMAGQVGYSAQTLSTGLYTVESAGYHGAQALTVMRAAAEGAKTENADLTTVTDAVTSAMQDYHFGADQAATVTSKMVAAVGDGKTTFEQLTGAMSAILPKAAAAHVNLDEILGDLSSMTLHGVSAEQASQNLADALSHLANPTLAQTKELAALGLSAADLSKNLGKTGVSGAMLEIEQAVLQHMGPAGTTLLNAFNQSKQAAADAKTMFESLPPAAKKVAQSVLDGSLSFKEFRKSGGGLAVDQKALVDQWFSVQKSASGFSDALKTGGNASQTFSQAMAKATGDSASLNVGLMLTGENAATVQKNIKDIAGATAEAGGHVKGWGEVQGTFNQKLDEVKSSMGAWLIQMGTALLPMLTSFIGSLQDTAHWIGENKNWLGLIAATVGGAAAGFLAFKAAALGVSLVTKIMNIDWIAFNATLRANAIILIVTAVVALVAGLIYAYTHFKWFHDLINTIGTFIKNVFVAVWHGLVVAFNAVIDAAKAVGQWFKWLWETILQPIFNVISIAARILAAVFITVLVTPMVLIIRNVLAPVFTWLWETVLKPVFGFIGNIFSWLYNTVIKVIIGAIKLEIQVWAAIFTWLWNTIVKPIFGFIGNIFDWIYNHVIKPIVAGIKLEIKLWADVLSWLWHTIVEPVFHGISSVISTVWNSGIKPVFEGIKTGVQKVGEAFGAAKDFIIKVWDGVKDAAATPIHWVVDKVYTHGIKMVWDKVADFVHLSHLPDAPQFAAGGALPWSQVGAGFRTNGPRAIVGEGNSLWPEYVIPTDPAHRRNAMALWASAGQEMQMLAGGGILGSIGSFFSDLVGGAIDFFKDPIGSVGKGLHTVMNDLAGQVTSPIGKLAFGIPGQAIDGLINMVKSWFSSGSGGGAVGAGVQQWAPQVLQALAMLGQPASWLPVVLRRMNQESGGNPMAINLTDINAQRGDPSRGLMQTIGSTFAAYAGPFSGRGIYDPLANIYAGLNYAIHRYGTLDALNRPGGYDSGGWLMPGVTPTVNATGRPEAVLTESQWSMVRASLGRTHGGDRVYNITNHDPAGVVAEIQRREHLEMVTTT